MKGSDDKVRMSQNAINSIRSRLTSLDCHNIDEAVIDETTTIAIDEYAEPMEGGSACAKYA